MGFPLPVDAPANRGWKALASGARALDIKRENRRVKNFKEEGVTGVLHNNT
jgi:hypothetical protein